MQQGTRRVARITSLAVAAAAFAVPLAIASPASALGATVTATPNDNLVDGQHISVSGSGFTASEQLALVECTTAEPSPASGAADCDESGAVVTQADSSGNISKVNFTVTSGAVGSSGAFCPSKTVGGACYLVAADTTTGAALTSTTLTLAPVISITPDKNVKSGQTVEVSGYGFPAAMTAYVTECANPPGANTCNGASNVQQQTTVNGTFSNAGVKVITGTWGGKSCSAGGSCLITATTDITATQPDQSTASPFTFANVVTKVPTQVFVNPPKVAHHKVKLSGVTESKNAGVSGLKVTAYERAKGSKKWHKAKSGKSHKHGVFTIKGLKHFSHKEQYRVTHKTQKIGATIYKASTSSTVTRK